MYPNVDRSTVYNSQTWKQPRCPLTDEWIKKTNIESIIQSEVTQKEKNK